MSTIPTRERPLQNSAQSSAGGQWVNQGAYRADLDIETAAFGYDGQYLYFRMTQYGKGFNASAGDLAGLWRVRQRHPLQHPAERDARPAHAGRPGERRDHPECDGRQARALDRSIRVVRNLGQHVVLGREQRRRQERNHDHERGRRTRGQWLGDQDRRGWPYRGCEPEPGRALRADRTRRERPRRETA